MLYHPFTDWPDLLLVENKTYGSYVKAFRAYELLYTHLEDFYNEPEGEPEGERLDLDLDSGDKVL